MKKPVLVIMAAGMGSRYGGLKQIDPVDEYGNIIMDFSIYDAIKAGFEKVIFIIKKENLQSFKEAVGNRLNTYIEVAYVFQELDYLPVGYTVPPGRIKPWGTGHAILSCLHEIKGPFAVINADDYYGREAFRSIYTFLFQNQDDDCYRFAMVAYQLINTLTENGSVSRGICQVDESLNLESVTERTKIMKRAEGPACYEEETGWQELPKDAYVSMNMWGFSMGMLKELAIQFPAFLENQVRENPLKSEFYLPSVVSSLIEEGKAVVKVLPTKDKWFGITYKEDKESVKESVKQLKEQGLYPQKLWEEGD